MSAPRPIVAPRVGDLVLVGAPSVSMPVDWWFARVLWAAGDEVLVSQPDFSGGRDIRQLLPIDYIRAIGDNSDVQAFKDRCVEEMRLLTRRVGKAETALVKARAAVWNRLDAIQAAGTQRLTSGGQAVG